MAETKKKKSGRPTKEQKAKIKEKSNLMWKEKRKAENRMNLKRQKIYCDCVLAKNIDLFCEIQYFLNSYN